MFSSSFSVANNFQPANPLTEQHHPNGEAKRKPHLLTFSIESSYQRQSWIHTTDRQALVQAKLLKKVQRRQRMTYSLAPESSQFSDLRTAWPVTRSDEVHKLR